MKQHEIPVAPNGRNLIEEAFLKLDSKKHLWAFLNDVLTTKEIDDIAARLEVAYLLHKGYSYNEVIAATGASSTTVRRVNKCLQGEDGGYRWMLDGQSNE